jgi:acetyltransferase-like isoleucine patch superfamily enzyme
MENIFFDLKKLKYLGEGCIIGKTVRIRQPEKCIIGDGTIIDDFTYIAPEIQIGKHCHIASNVSIGGGASKFTMGNYSTLSNGVSVHCASSDYSKVSMDLPSIPKDIQFGGEIQEIYIEDFVTVGAHSCILPGVYLPRCTAFGAYSLIVKKNYLAFGLYAGIPCKLLKYRDSDQFEKVKHLYNLYE